MAHPIKLYDTVTANVSYKSVPFSVKKPQSVTINVIDNEVFGGRTKAGKQVYFTLNDIVCNTINH